MGIWDLFKFSSLFFEELEAFVLYHGTIKVLRVKHGFEPSAKLSIQLKLAIYQYSCACAARILS
jgi:hypothetical protein